MEPCKKSRSIILQDDLFNSWKYSTIKIYDTLFFNRFGVVPYFFVRGLRYPVEKL